MTNIRKQITVNRPQNEEEMWRQIDEMGDVHRDESLKEFQQTAVDVFDGMSKRFMNGETEDAYMKDVALGLRVERAVRKESHEDRWARQHMIAQDLDKVNDELRKHAMGTEPWEQLMAKRLVLESLL